MPTVHSYRYYGLVLAVSAWTGLIFLAPGMKFLELGEHSLVYVIFSSICHQETERCFVLFGSPLAVCARCTGLYVGFWIGLLVIPHMKSLSRLIADNPRIILIFFLPMVIDLLFPSLNTHWTRFITGLIASFPISILVWWGVAQIGEPVLKRSHS